jgi:hypothetical protein
MCLQSEEWQDVREDLIEDLYIRAENEARKAVIAQQSKNKRKVSTHEGRRARGRKE